MGHMKLEITEAEVKQEKEITFLGYRVLKGDVQGGGGNWGTLRIPFGKIGEP